MGSIDVKRPLNTQIFAPILSWCKKNHRVRTILRVGANFSKVRNSCDNFVRLGSGLCKILHRKRPIFYTNLCQYLCKLKVF